MPSSPEPWLRGTASDVSPYIAPVLYSFIQAREDLAVHTEGLTAAQIWATPHGLGSVGFHIRHIGRSTDRLMSYLRDSQLCEAQFAALQSEKEAGESREELLAELDRHFEKAEGVIRSLDPATLTEARGVGRQRLPTTVIGLLTHIAEHTQRHVGQAISSARVVRGTTL